jgi:putative MATE family efflux protein
LLKNYERKFFTMSERAKKTPTFDRSLIEGPLAPAIWAIVWPTLLQNIVAGLQGLIDHVMVGRFVGFEANAAIGISWQIFLVVVVFISSLYSGMGVLVARYAGAGDSDKVNRVVFQVFLISLAIGVGIFAPVGYLISPYLLTLVHAEPGVVVEALPYLRTMFVSGLGMMLFYMLAGALRAAGDAKTPLRLGIALTVINLSLNVILIPIFGTFGAALGTAIANLAVSGYAVWKLFTHRLVIQLSFDLGCRPDWEILRSVFRFGLPTGFQAVVMNIGGVILLRYVGSLAAGAAAQAAYAICYTQLFSFITWGSNALMAAAITITGQNLGADRPDRAVKAPMACSLLGLLLAVPMASAYFFFPEVLLGIFGMEDELVLSIGAQLLAYLSVSSFFVTIALSYTGALQGAGDTKSPLYISLFSQLALPIGMCAFFAATRELTASHIWLAIVLGHVSRGVLSVLRFRQGKWKDIEVS